MEKCPTEIVWHIAANLNSKDIEALSSCNQQLQRQLDDNFWQTIVHGTKIEVTWKHEFKRRELFYILRRKYPEEIRGINNTTPLIELKRVQKILLKRTENECLEVFREAISLMIMYLELIPM